MARLVAGAVIEPIELVALDGAHLPVPGERRVHLQFRRFAGCPICSLHLRGFAERHAEVEAAGITEVVFFHSAAEHLQGYQSQLPFAVIADPDQVYYRRFGVERGVRSLADPRALAAAVRGGRRWMAHRGEPDWAGVGENDGTTHLGLPADFLIGSDGTLMDVHYGRHADDQWSVDELLAISRAANGS
jgi:hypothetical protein